MNRKQVLNISSVTEVVTAPKKSKKYIFCFFFNSSCIEIVFISITDCRNGSRATTLHIPRFSPLNPLSRQTVSCWPSKWEFAGSSG